MPRRRRNPPPESRGGCQDRRQSTTRRIQNRIDHLCERFTVVGIQYDHESHNSDDTRNRIRAHMSARLPIIERLHETKRSRRSSSHHRTSGIVRPPPQAGTRSTLLQVVHNDTPRHHMHTKKPSEDDLDFARPRKAHPKIPDGDQGQDRVRRTVRNSGERTVQRTLQPNGTSHNTSHKGDGLSYDHETHTAEIPLVLHLYR